MAPGYTGDVDPTSENYGVAPKVVKIKRSNFKKNIPIFLMMLICILLLGLALKFRPRGVFGEHNGIKFYYCEKWDMGIKYSKLILTHPDGTIEKIYDGNRSYVIGDSSADYYSISNMGVVYKSNSTKMMDHPQIQEEVAKRKAVLEKVLAKANQTYQLWRNDVILPLRE